MDFTRISAEIGDNIETMSKNVRQMQSMTNQTQLNELQHATNLLARDINNLLKELSSMANPANTTELRRRRLMKERLTSDFSEVLNSFQKVQRMAAQREKENVQRARSQSQAGSQRQFDWDVERGENLVDIPGQQQTQQQLDDDVDLDELREREQQIRRIESDIVEVNQIFRDLGTMVHEQGETVDSIELNINRATTQVSDAAQQIARARDYQNRARRKTCFLAMIFFAIMFFFILVTYLSGK